MKVDNMKVSDFLYLLDCMQEECCESTCPNCRYFDFCEIDLSSIDSASIERTVEGYAEANGLIDRMHYVNQKWIPVSERLPEFGTDVMIQCDDGHIDVGYLENKLNALRWMSYLVVYTFGYVVAWMPLPEPYIPNKGDTE